jgi:two-component system, OmpR family, sensor kinase
MKLKYRLLLCFALVALACGAVNFLLVKRATEAQFRSFVFSGDEAKARVYAGILGDYYSGKGSWDGLQGFLSGIPALLFSRLDESVRGEGGSAPSGARSLGAFGALLSDRIAVADSAGLIVADTSEKILGTVHPAMHLARGAPIMADFERVGTVLVGSMVDSTFTGSSERFILSIARSLALAVALSMAIAVLLGLAFSARVTGPLASLSAAVEKVASGDLSVLVPVDGRDEVASLSESFNAMTGELRRLEEAKRRIIADSAHELRTPVTLIRGTLEAMLDGIYPADEASLRSALDETIRLSRLIDTLRELELIDSGELELSLEALDAGAIVGKAASLFRPAAAEKGIELSVAEGGADGLGIEADALRLDEVLYNLLANAIKYTPRGGRIELSALAAEGWVCIRVDDSGPGVPEAERRSVLERFYRTDKSRAQDSGGRGLGLSIAYEIVKAHGGRIEVGASRLGGASFAVSLPERGG